MKQLNLEIKTIQLETPAAKYIPYQQRNLNTQNLIKNRDVGLEKWESAYLVG